MLQKGSVMSERNHAKDRLRAVLEAQNTLSLALHAARIGAVPPISTERPRISSADIERHLREKWERATTTDDRECVRAMIVSTADSGVLDEDAEQRLRALCF